MRLIRKDDILANLSYLVSTNVAADATAEYHSGTAYFAGNQVKVTGTGGGASTATFKIYEALQSTTGNDPTTDVGTVTQFTGTYWREVGTVDEYKMFDNVPQDQTVNATSIAVEIQTGELITALGLVNVDAADVNITVTDAAEGEVYNQTFDLVSDSGIDNWYDFFFEPVVRFSNFAVFDLPPYLDAIVSITLSVSSGDVSCGACVVGNSLDLGDTQYGAEFTITDYSEIDYDTEAKRVTFQEGSYTDDGTFEIFVDNAKFSHLKQALTSLRNAPTVWVADVDRTGTILFGYYREFELILSGPTISLCNLEIAGLT